MKKRKKISFRMHITIVFAVAVACVVLVCWGACKLFLKDYYENNKLDQLEETYSAINASLGTSGVVSEQYDALAEYCYRITSDEHITVAFSYYDEDGNLILFSTSFSDTENEETSTEDSVSVSDVNEKDIETVPSQVPFPKILPKDESDSTDSDTENPPDKRNRDGMENGQDLFLFYSGFDSNLINANIGETLRTAENYKISTLTYSASETKSYDLHGTTDCGLFIVLRANQSNITSAADAACQFLTYVGLIVIVLGSVMVFVLSRFITRPIEHMSKAADEMAHLHFDVHCPESKTREIDSLAGSLNHLSDELETTIGELKESNNELQKDIAHKVEIDNMRTEFLSNVSHELKTPIALIQGYAEGLNDNINDDAESRQFYCDVIIDEAKKMNTMVKKLLTLNQIECGQDMLSMERFDLVTLLRSVIESTEVLGKEKNVMVHFKETEPVYVWADEYMIEEVVTNYVSNAFHHVCKSNEIAVSLVKKDKLVRCSVYNTGNPIPEDDLDKIWTKFYKVDKARTREYGGSGIGLSIVKAIMDNHNRDFGVINHEGGVEFWFELELAAVEDEETEDDSSN